jgi:hypothetical protein
MKMLRRFLKRLMASTMRRHDDERLNKEIEEHLALQTAENLRAGLSPEEARRQAVLKFGALEAIMEEYREQFESSLRLTRRNFPQPVAKQQSM